MSRAIQILVSLQEGSKSLEDCAVRLGVHKSTVLRLLQTMEAERFVTHDARHQYILGSRLFELANSALAQRSVRDVARPHLEDLNRRTGQTVHLADYESGTVVYIDKLEAQTGIQMYSRVGLRAALHATAVGKILVADLPEAERERVAADIEYESFTDKTITNAADFLAELARVRVDGFARDHREHESFINCIAAPIRDGSGSVVAAVSLSAPTVSLSDQEVLALRPLLLRAAAAASADLGWVPRPPSSSHRGAS
ncbi:MAG: IclR family transcriptional regulator [Propioniciclava sp.]